MTVTAEVALSEVAARVLEDCAFLFVDAVEADTAPPSAGRAIAASIAIGAREPRTLKIVATRPLLVEAAANMLGTEGDDPEAYGSAEQALSELLNIVAGSFVARFYGTEQECPLGIPQRVEAVPPGEGNVVVTLVADAGNYLRLELA